jgi:hypothetical protein
MPASRESLTDGYNLDQTDKVVETRKKNAVSQKQYRERKKAQEQATQQKGQWTNIVISSDTHIFQWCYWN